MRRSRPSDTSALVATLRALAHEGYTSVGGFSDPFARELLPPLWSAIYGLALRRLRKRWATLSDARKSRLDALPLRTLAIDVELERAIAPSVKQLVILGAGLDSRAHRLEYLRDVRVFEVDHPATQSFKRRVAARLPRAANELVYVTVDFERDRLADRLRDAGYDPSVPTAWIWEGVVMYLTDDALRGTLRGIRSLSATGSVLIVNYHEITPEDAPEARGRRLFLRVVGEPQIGERTREAMARELTEAGFALLRDSGAHDWVTQFGGRFPVHPIGLVMRLAVAELAPRPHHGE